MGHFLAQNHICTLLLMSSLNFSEIVSSVRQWKVVLGIYVGFLRKIVMMSRGPKYTRWQALKSGLTWEFRVHKGNFLLCSKSEKRVILGQKSTFMNFSQNLFFLHGLHVRDASTHLSNHGYRTIQRYKSSVEQLFCITY